MSNQSTMLLGFGLVLAFLVMSKKGKAITKKVSGKISGGSGGGGLRSMPLAPTNPVEPTTINVTVNDDEPTEPQAAPTAGGGEPEGGASGSGASVPSSGEGSTPPPDPSPTSPPASPTASFSGDAADIDDFEYFGFVD